MRNILITGGCGFIGVNLVEYLLSKNPIKGLEKIIVIDNLVLGKKEYVKDYDVEFIECDIRDIEKLEKVFTNYKLDGIIHLAADTRVLDSIENPDYNFGVNVIGTYNLLKLCKKYDVERFVFASTGGAIIGEATPPVHEEMVPRPISPYGASKLAGEAYCSAFAGSYGMKTVSLRFSNVYGRHSYHKGSVVAKFFKQILKGEPLVVYGDGTQTRDFVFASDLCSAIVKAMEIDKGGEMFQLGSGRGTSINELIELIKEVVGPDYTFKVVYENFRPGEIKHTYSDISKARNVLGYEPKVSLREGLKRTFEWFLESYNRLGA